MIKHPLGNYLVAASFLALTVSPIHADSFLVVPNAQTSAVGNDNGGSLAGGPFDAQVQLDFGRGQFSSVPGDLLINQFAFRAAPGTGSMDVTDTSVSIYMSTSRYAPNTAGSNTLITSTFANNLGPNNTLVFSRGPGTLFSSPGCAGPGPCPFDMVFNLSTPFLYNPAQGFLLIDFQFTGFTGIGNGSFDIEDYDSPGGPVATVENLDGGSPTTGVVQLSGNIVQFGFTAVPEPGSLALVTSVLGLLSLFAIIRRRQSS